MLKTIFSEFTRMSLTHGTLSLSVRCDGRRCREAPTGKSKSLNIGSRQQELNRIERENAAILRRIQEQNNRASEFSIKKMETEWKDTLEHRKLASQWDGKGDDA